MPPDGAQAPGHVEANAAAWAYAMDALALLAVDPAGLGGIVLRAQAGPVRDRWLGVLPGVFGIVRRMPAAIGDQALLGGLDLAATLKAGKPVVSQGLLQAARGGVLVALMAERMEAGVSARVAAALDAGAGFAMVALDEGIAPDERAGAALLDRLAFRVDLASASHRDATMFLPDGLDSARTRLGRVLVDDDILVALCNAALAFGVESARAPLLALRAARAAAALDGRTVVSAEDAALATRLVLAPRATRLPAAEQESEAPPAPDEAPETAGEPDAAEAGETRGQSQDVLSDMLLEAAKAAIPADLLARLQAQDFRGRPDGQGKQGARQSGTQRGRPVGVRAASPGAGLRLNLIETLRAAAPWQTLRRRQDLSGTSSRILLRREDFRVTRTEQRGRSTTIFLVDASGSAALNRLAEAKGAVELLLADCYRRRDQVAVIAFRGKAAQLLLAPTRSLVAAKRGLAGLPGGGGTPLAAGIDAGCLLADTVMRGGATPMLVVLTDGRANVTRAGGAGREVAAHEAAEAGRRVRASGFAALVLDTAPRPGPEASRLAAAMGALYVPLPYADAAAVSGAVRLAGRA